MISCLSGRLSLFTGPPQLCHISPLRLSSRHLTPVPSLGCDLQSLGLSTQLPHPPWQACRHTSQDGYWRSALISVQNSLHFAFCTPVIVLSSGFLSCTLVPAQERVSMCAETFPPSQLLPRYSGSVWIPLSLSLFNFFSSFILPYPFMWGLVCLFGRQTSSASIQQVFCRNGSHAYVFLMQGER